MATKKATNFTISTQADFLKFVENLPICNSKQKVKVKATVTDLKSLDLLKLKDLEESIYLSGANIEFNLRGDVGPFSAALLNRRFKRTGFSGRHFDLSIPASVSSEEKNMLVDRISKCVKSDAEKEIKVLIDKGAKISMKEAKDLGLIDQEIDLSKRRGQSQKTNAVVTSESTQSSETVTP
jgi:hypothetical protein